MVIAVPIGVVIYPNGALITKHWDLICHWDLTTCHIHEFNRRLHAYGFWVGFVIKNIYLMAHPT